MGKPYNGHASWNAWNVSLWIGGDYGLYSMAREYAARGPTRVEAARAHTGGRLTAAQKQEIAGIVAALTEVT